MAARDAIPVFTENFPRNLEAIRTFLGTEGRPAYDRLLDRLFDDIIPSVCRFPQSGRPLLDQPTRSVETESLVKRLHTLLRPGDDLREFLVDEYLLLYIRRRHRLLFLTIKHHRQLSFDLNRFWR